ncbi:hypothetical protein [Microbispora bryophytorum]|uniref:hypothetical protein n=1 Tax=Microbispora bryophytorum TaxID=1460882 RepID=UPI0011588B00|nr:hypothetical protein [Microbispora bryophytorum]MBD3135020.1 hypothetical protein [Microbispora bryophytorum]TQS08743.1 hypothetical protein FLX07_05715 [Microbispora bryophytorum]
MVGERPPALASIPASGTRLSRGCSAPFRAQRTTATAATRAGASPAHGLAAVRTTVGRTDQVTARR